MFQAPNTLLGHMALVSNNPGAKGGALGVITLEDVIEELIGEVTLHNMQYAQLETDTFE